MSRGPEFRLGRLIGLAMADRLIEFSRPGATIIDNHPTVIQDRRKPAAPGASLPLARRRRTDWPQP